MIRKNEKFLAWFILFTGVLIWQCDKKNPVKGDGADDTVEEVHTFGDVNAQYYVYSDGRTWDLTAENNMTVQNIEAVSYLASNGGTFHIKIFIRGQEVAHWEQYVGSTTYTAYTHSKSVNFSLYAGNTITYKIYGGSYSTPVGGIRGGSSVTLTGVEGEEGPVAVPEQYDGIPAFWYREVFIEDFNDNSSGWWIADETEFKTSITGGYYEIINKTSEHSWLFWNQVSGLNSAQNFEIEANIKIQETDTPNYGNGLIWGCSDAGGQLRYFCQVFTSQSCLVGDDLGETKEIWIDWTSSAPVNGIGQYNKLTVRKYAGKYYFFINETLIGEHDFKAFYGDFFGFLVHSGTTVRADDLRIYHLNETSMQKITEKSRRSGGSQREMEWRKIK